MRKESGKKNFNGSKERRMNKEEERMKKEKGLKWMIWNLQWTFKVLKVIKVER